MKDKKIEVVKNWPELKSVRDIQIFIGFANFYQWFIWGFNKIVVPLISILKTTKTLDLAQRDNDNKVVENGGDRNLSKSKKSKNAKSGIQMHIEATREPTFPTPGTRKAFNKLRQVFTKDPILLHFDPEYHIWIKTNASGYVIGKIINQLTSDLVILDSESNLTQYNFGQWHPIAYLFRKMIPA